jgi:hypothetical protein
VTIVGYSRGINNLGVLVGPYWKPTPKSKNSRRGSPPQGWQLKVQKNLTASETAKRGGMATSQGKFR